MARLNLTLSDDTFERLCELADAQNQTRAGFARQLLLTALHRIDRRQRMEQLARDYAEARSDTDTLLAEISLGQLDLLDG